MKISTNWLRQYIDFDWTPEQLDERLTMCGLEVEGIDLFESIKGSLEGVVVGHVVSVAKHPDADRLRVCKVDVGEAELLNIVCGAPNVAEGQKVAVARIGATLYPTGSSEGLQIKKSKIRGELSEGMICALDELGLGSDHSGIVILDASIAVGTPCAEIFGVETDTVLEIGLTANRADAACHFGVARDIAALLRKKARHPFKGEEKTAPKGIFKIELKDTLRCPRYAGILISGIKVAPSPEWMQNRLKAIGLRPINNVVDITNYVLHELGQPLHAFDADKVAGKTIIVQTHAAPFKFTTLDGAERNLLPTDLLICDGEKPVAIAGVMGGQNSEVNDSTKNIFLESAYFNPATVRQTAKRLVLKTDASFRFERGTDPNLPLIAALHAAQLITELCGGAIEEIQDVGQTSFPHFEIQFHVARANQLMGKDFSFDELSEILSCLEIGIEEGKDNEHLLLKVPPYRVDVKRPQDVMEEILRIYGQNNVLRKNKMLISLLPEPKVQPFRLRQRYFDFLAANGFNEILTNPLVPIRYKSESSVNLLNNLSEDLAVLRENLLVTALDVIEYNHNRKNTDLRLFEIGKTYKVTEGKYVEKEWASFFLTGNTNSVHWKEKSQASSFFTLKKEMERMQTWFGFAGKFKVMDNALAENAEAWDYGMELELKGKTIARFGRVKQSLLKGRDIKGDVFFGLVDWELLVSLNAAGKVEFKELPKYPSLRRDISMMVPENISFAVIEQAIQSCNPKLIREIFIFDVYKGEKIEAGKKSYAVGVTLLDETKTLTDEAADALMKKIFTRLETENGVQIRK